MATLPLITSVTTTLDGTGAGIASIGPTAQGEVWTVGNVAVHTSTNANESICRVYVGAAGSTSVLLGATNTGSSGDNDSGLSQVLRVGQAITAVWTEGDIGATAYLSVTGSKVV